MANFAFNTGKGTHAELTRNVDTNSPANSVLVLVLYEAIEAQGTLQDRATKSAIDGGANTVATFSGYSNKVMDDTAVAITIDNTNDRQNGDFDDQLWTATSGNATVSAILYYDPDSTGGTDADLIPLFHWDFAHTPNGGTVTAQPATEGFSRAT